MAHSHDTYANDSEMILKDDKLPTAISISTLLNPFLGLVIELNPNLSDEDEIMALTIEVSTQW